MRHWDRTPYRVRFRILTTFGLLLLGLARPVVAQESPYSRSWRPVPATPTWGNIGSLAYGGLPAKVLADPLDRLGPGAAERSGRLVYCAVMPVPPEGGMTPYALIRSLGPRASAGDLPTPYRLWTSVDAYSPSISVSGRYVLVRNGDLADYHNPYHSVLLIDTVGSQWWVLPDWVDGDSFWSSDGRRIAYLATSGRAAGSPHSLAVFDLVTGRRRLIIPPSGKDSAYPADPAWSGGELLYTAWIDRPRELAIWECHPDGSGRRQLIPNARVPIPSPDGRWIAFIGPAVAQKAQPPAGAEPGWTASEWVWLYDRRTARRYPVAPAATEPTTNTEVALRWTPDSRRLLICTTGTDADGIGRVSIQEAMLADHGIPTSSSRPPSTGSGVRLVGHIPQVGTVPIGVGFDLRCVHTLRVSLDGRSLFYTISNWTTRKVQMPGGPLVDDAGLATTVSALNLGTGNSEEICHIDANWGVDFVEMPVPATSPAKIRPEPNKQKHR